MKKLLLTALVALVGITASAQVYVGGELGFWRNYNANETYLSVNPEVGYNLSDKWAVGVDLGYGYEYEQGAKTRSYTVAPYARYKVAELGPVNVFVDGGAAVGSRHYVHGNTYTEWEVGVKPGVAVNLNEKLSFVTHFGFVGYRDNDAPKWSPWREGYETGLGAMFSGKELTFGLYYNF